ncbi:MAG: hypothetical protein JWO32_2380, partial [Bacteroidetes bacterium]|nr:hypothetical protein [Bacteroidota bacterium]
QQFKNTSSDLQRLPNDWQKAFIATFPGTSMDERKYAEEVIKFTKGEAVYITPDCKNLVKDIIQTTNLFDGIIGNPLIAISDIYKAMRENNVVVSLDGHGADEYAFGYSGYSLDGFYEALKSNNEEQAKEYAKILSGLSPVYNAETLMRNFYSANSFKSRIKNSIKSVLKTENEKIKPFKNEWFNSEINKEALTTFTNPFSGISKTLFNDFHYFSLPVNLRDFDRAAMQNSIEIRMPFMDYRLVNYMFSLSVQSKLGGGYTKRIIRDSMKGIVPEPIRTRKLKIGIGSPIAEWMSGPLKEFTLDHLSSSKLDRMSFLNADRIRKDIENNYSTNNWNTDNASKTWCILNAMIINE